MVKKSWAGGTSCVEKEADTGPGAVGPAGGMGHPVLSGGGADSGEAEFRLAQSAAIFLGKQMES